MTRIVGTGGAEIEVDWPAEEVATYLASCKEEGRERAIFTRAGGQAIVVVYPEHVAFVVGDVTPDGRTTGDSQT